MAGHVPDARLRFPFMNIIMTLAIADSVHIISTFSQGLKKGMAKRDAIVESLRVNYLAVFLRAPPP